MCTFRRTVQCVVGRLRSSVYFILTMLCIPLTAQRVYFPYGFNVYFSPYGQVCSFPLRSGVYFIPSIQCVQPPNHFPYGPMCTFHSGPVSSFPLRRSLYGFALTIQCVLSGESFPLTVQCVLSPYNPECNFPLRSRVYFPLTVQNVLSPSNPEFTFPLRSSVYFPLTVQRDLPLMVQRDLLLTSSVYISVMVQ